MKQANNQKPIMSLAYLVSKPLADIRHTHQEGECAGIKCPYCRYEEQFQGNPFYMTIHSKEEKEV